MVLLPVMGAYLLWLAWSFGHGDYNAWGTLVVAPVLILVNVPLLRSAMRREREGRIARLIVIAFFVKLASALINSAVAVRLYGGVADARGYHGGGVTYSTAFRHGNFALEQQAEEGRRFIKVLTGVLYTVTGPSKFGGYLAFAILGFWGLYLFYRAFVCVFPDGNSFRYGVFVLLMPSLLFWSSAIGKEAWMIFALGVCALGAARLLSRQRGGLVILGLGLVASAQVRPHLSVLVMAALIPAFLVRRSPRRTPFGPLATVAGLAILVVFGFFVTSQFAEQFGLSSLSRSGVGNVLDSASRESSIGGSQIANLGPLAIPGVLFRPFPFEANNLQSLLASLEGMAMIAIVVFSWRRLTAAIRNLFRYPYLIFCLAYTVMFLAAFSSFGNFGLLARERVQVFPFVLVLLAFPIPSPSRHQRSTSRRVELPAVGWSV